MPNRNNLNIFQAQTKGMWQHRSNADHFYH